jgi:uncharacterized membrane protein
MRYVAVALIVLIVVVLAMGPLVVGRRQSARRTGQPFRTSGLVPIGVVVAALAAALAALSFAVRPSVAVIAAAAVAIVIAALILLRARPGVATGRGLPNVPTLIFVVLGGLMAAVGIAALVELLGPPSA